MHFAGSPRSAEAIAIANIAEAFDQKTSRTTPNPPLPEA